MKLYIALLLSFVAITGVTAPQYFNVTGKNYRNRYSTTTTSKEWVADIVEKNRGFAIMPIGISIPPNPDFMRPISVMNGNGFRLGAMRGEVRTFATVIRPFKKFDNFKITVSELKSSHGDIIAANQIQIANAVPAYDTKTIMGNDYIRHFITPGFPNILGPGQSRWLWCTVVVPDNAKPGVYTGSLDINGYFLKIELAVFDFDFHFPGRDRGCFIPGMLQHNDAKVPWGQSYWRAENLDSYFKFSKTRGFNAAFLYHADGDIRVENGKIICDWRELNTIAKSMRANGLDGVLGLDIRIPLFKAAGIGTGQIGKDGRPKQITQGKLDFFRQPEILKAAEIIICDLVKTSQEKNWGRVVMLPEEEANYTMGRKAAMIDAFTPLIMRLAGPERTTIVDNPCGSWWKGLDRGAINKVPLRIYCSYKAEHLAQAKADGATIYLYKGGDTSRALVGLSAPAYGAKGFFQWADNWSPRWSLTIFEDGAWYSTPEFEARRESFGDWYYFELHQQYENKLRETGKTAQADTMSRTRTQLTRADILNAENTYSRILQDVSDDELEAIRFVLMDEINSAANTLGEKLTTVAFDVSVGGSTRPMVSPGNLTESVQKTITASYVASPPVIDARKDPVYITESKENTRSDFVFSGGYLTRLAKQVLSEEERKKYTPSGTEFSILYGKKGLYLYWQCNHVDKKRFRSHGNGNGWMREDDSMNFFFRANEASPIYELLVSAAGEHCWMKDGEPQRENNIQVSSAARNPSGVVQEVMIPWSDLGYEGLPPESAQWQFNAARNYRYQISTWIPDEIGRRLPPGGILIFRGTPVNYATKQAPMVRGVPVAIFKKVPFSFYIYRFTPKGSDTFSIVLSNGGRKLPLGQFEVSGSSGKVELMIPEWAVPGSATFSLIPTRSGQIFIHKMIITK